MRALVVYESPWGNTEKVARAVAEALRAANAEVTIIDSDAAPATADGYDLVVVGRPTHAFPMTRLGTRAEAVTSHSAPHQPTRGIREWLNELGRPAVGFPAAAFDTRGDKPRLPTNESSSSLRRQSSFSWSLPQLAQHCHLVCP